MHLFKGTSLSKVDQRVQRLDRNRDHDELARLLQKHEEARR